MEPDKTKTLLFYHLSLYLSFQLSLSLTLSCYLFSYMHTPPFLTPTCFLSLSLSLCISLTFLSPSFYTPPFPCLLPLPLLSVAWITTRQQGEAGHCYSSSLSLFLCFDRTENTSLFLDVWEKFISLFSYIQKSLYTSQYRNDYMWTRLSTDKLSWRNNRHRS